MPSVSGALVYGVLRYLCNQSSCSVVVFFFCVIKEKKILCVVLWRVLFAWVQMLSSDSVITETPGTKHWQPIRKNKNQEESEVKRTSVVRVNFVFGSKALMKGSMFARFFFFKLPTRSQIHTFFFFSIRSRLSLRAPWCFLLMGHSKNKELKMHHRWC